MWINLQKEPYILLLTKIRAMTQRERLIKGGYVPVDLKAGNVKVGDSIANNNMCFGVLVKITKKGNYKVQFDMDYPGDKPIKFDAEKFERFFLVNKRKKK
jgi:hypothetical protein